MGIDTVIAVIQHSCAVMRYHCVDGKCLGGSNCCMPLNTWNGKIIRYTDAQFTHSHTHMHSHSYRYMHVRTHILLVHVHAKKLILHKKAINFIMVLIFYPTQISIHVHVCTFTRFCVTIITNIVLSRHKHRGFKV
jgi:hypothetical protein